MYGTLLLLHSWLRWAVLLAGLLAVARAFSGWRSRRPWTLHDERIGFWFITSLDVQFLLGLVLYVGFSPMTRAAFQNFGVTMRDDVLRFWAVEHVFGMVLAIALAHIGRSRVHKTGDDGRRHTLSLIFFALALILILGSIPWPTLQHGRPLLRW